MVMKIFHRYSAYSLLFLSLCFSVNIVMIRIFDMNIPRGPDIIPIAVASDLSLSPNQLLASFVTGFFRKAWLLMHMIWPKYQIHISVNVEINRKDDPRSITMQPNEMHVFKPNQSISHTEKKFAGKYITKSEYFAMFSTSLFSSGLIIDMTFLFVLNEPWTDPVAAEDKKNDMSTTQRYL